MSMHPQPVGPVPEDTARVARAAFPKGNLYMQMRDVLGTIYADEDFAELFEVRGRPAIAPWRLALVTVMQFSEGLSDRQAAEAVRARIDWKYALGLQLSDPGFNFSVLSEFRSRLLEGGKERLLLEKLLEGCKERGYLKARGRQRTDSTHVLGSLRVLSKWERTAETLRAALNALASVEPEWLQEHADPENQQDHVEAPSLSQGSGVASPLPPRFLLPQARDLGLHVEALQRTIQGTLGPRTNSSRQADLLYLETSTYYYKLGNIFGERRRIL